MTAIVLNFIFFQYFIIYYCCMFDSIIFIFKFDHVVFYKSNDAYNLCVMKLYQKRSILPFGNVA